MEQGETRGDGRLRVEQGEGWAEEGKVGRGLGGGGYEDGGRGGGG